MAATTIRQMVTKGLREGGIIEVGGTPDADQFEEGLDLLQGIYLSFFGNELGELLSTVNFGTAGLINAYAIEQDVSNDVLSSYLPSNNRYVFNINSSETLYLSPNPQDGARLGVIDNGNNFSTYHITIDGNGRQIEGASSVVLNTNGYNQEWFYRADLGAWTKIIDLVDSDLSPLPREFDDLLSTVLAIRVNPRYGAQTAQETADVLTRMKKQFKARYRQVTEQISEPGLYRLPSNRYWKYYPSRIEDFNKGNF